MPVRRRDTVTVMQRWRTTTGTIACGLALIAVPPLAAEEATLSEAAPRDAIFRDWLLQNHEGEVGECCTNADSAEAEIALVRRVLDELGRQERALRPELKLLVETATPGNDPRWRRLYTEACEARRERCLRPLLAKWRRIMFAKHHRFLRTMHT